MPGKILAICDEDSLYADALMQYVNRRKKVPFEAHAFSDPEGLAAFCSEHHTAVALVPEKNDYLKSGTLPDGRRLADTVLLLTDQPHTEEPNCLYRFQSAGSLLRCVMEQYSLHAAMGTILTREKGEMIGIYSPLGGCLKTSFAVAAAQLIGLVRPTLLLSLDAVSGLMEISHQNAERDLSEAFFYIRKGETGFAYHLQALSVSIGACDLIPPFRNAQDLMSVGEEEWEVLLAGIRRELSYQTIVIDFGQIGARFPLLLSACRCLYMPVKEDPLSEIRVSAFEKETEGILDPELTSLTKINLSKMKTPISEDMFLEQLPYSELGRYVRQLLVRDGVLSGES